MFYNNLFQGSILNENYLTLYGVQTDLTAYNTMFCNRPFIIIVWSQMYAIRLSFRYLYTNIW